MFEEEASLQVLQNRVEGAVGTLFTKVLARQQGATVHP